jgi:hypothetical protein
VDLDRDLLNYTPRFNIAPEQTSPTIPVIIRHSGTNECRLMCWEGKEWFYEVSSTAIAALQLKVYLKPNHKLWPYVRLDMIGGFLIVLITNHVVSDA